MEIFKIELLNELWKLIIDMAEEKTLKSYIDGDSKTDYVWMVKSNYYCIYDLNLYNDLIFNVIKDNEKESYLRRLNAIKNTWNIYLDIKSEINEIGFDKLIEKEKKKLIGKFKEMLDYKHIEYSEDMDFLELMGLVSHYYNYASYYFDDCYYSLVEGYVYNDLDMEEKIYLNEVEILWNVRDLYLELNSYKEHANDYIDIEINSSDEYTKLIKELKEKYRMLYKEMLDFVDVKYEESDFDYYRCLVEEHYPWYRNLIHDLFGNFSLKENYVTQLDYVSKVYEELSKTYVSSYSVNKKQYDNNSKDLNNFEFDYDDVLFEIEEDEVFVEKYGDKYI